MTKSHIKEWCRKHDYSPIIIGFEGAERCIICGYGKDHPLHNRGSGAQKQVSLF